MSNKETSEIETKNLNEGNVEAKPAAKKKAASKVVLKSKDADKKASKSKQVEVKQKFRITIKGYDQKVLDLSVSDIIDTAKRTGSIIVGPIPLPTKRVRYTVNRSTHVNKKSREQFEHRTHSRLLEIVNPQMETIDALQSLTLPSGVDIHIKL
jgi:small subunit ribosomal protein S10